MAVIIPDDIREIAGQSEPQQIKIIFDYIKYLKEQIEFWGGNRKKEMSSISAVIDTLSSDVEALENKSLAIKTVTISNATVNAYGGIATDLYIGQDEHVVGVCTSASALYNMHPIVSVSEQSNSKYGRWYIVVEDFTGTRAAEGTSLGDLTIFYIEKE